MRHLKRFNESTEDEINRILDKISNNGIESLTREEKSKLDKFNGKYDDPKSSEEMTFDKDGNILVNGVPYSQWNLDQKRGKTDEPKEVKKTPDKPINSNYKKLKSNYENYDILHDDKKIVVAVVVRGSKRYYYIYFRDVNVEERYAVIKMIYNTNSRSNYPFDIYDNYDNKLEFNKIESYLSSVGLSFGDFNNAWHYVEDNYINQGYT